MTNSHIPSVPAKLGAPAMPDAAAPTPPAPSPSDVLRCLLSYESVTTECTDLGLIPGSEKGEPTTRVLVPLHVFDQARAALGVGK